MLSSDCSQIGTGSSNSLRSTIQSIVFLHFLENRPKSARMRGDFRLRTDPENVSYGAIRQKTQPVRRNDTLIGCYMTKVRGLLRLARIRTLATPQQRANQLITFDY